MAREWSPGAIWNLPKCGWVIKWMWGKQQRWKWGFSVLMGTRVASVCCRLWAGQFLITEPCLWLQKRQRCRLPLIEKKKLLKSSFSAWFDMTSEVHIPPIPRFLYRMIWYLQLINLRFKQNHVGSVQLFEARCAGYCCLSGSYVCVLWYYAWAKRRTTEPTT